jgi:hypothetical protein
MPLAERLGGTGERSSRPDAVEPNVGLSIADVERVCRTYDVRCTPPSGGGSPYKVSHASQREILTVPFCRPIKPVYVRELVRFIDAIRNSNAKA